MPPAQSPSSPPCAASRRLLGWLAAAILAHPGTAAAAETASARAALTAVATTDAVQRAPKVIYAEPARMLFDGRGEEKGLINYSASGELLWQPEGQQYRASLELSAFGFRVRTWTSQGVLTGDGLQPTRFVDTPRGAPQATDFQRDKGVIAFSDDRPVVPLQTGAQDKLSALLQLSVVLDAEPQAFPAGSHVRFQAADAHRAEIWVFQVGATETLKLPGGTLRTIKLTKEPTVDFDQRIEVWLAPTMQHLPVRLRITEANGTFADLRWRKTEKPG